MKFIDIINEDEQSEWDKLYKKTQLVFKTLRKGRIRTKSGVVFSYKIPKEETHISVASSSGNNDLTAYIMCEKIKIREESKECSDISYSMFGELIKRKFSHFDILFIFNVYPEDIEKYEPQPINEDFQIEKKLSKAKNVFKALRKGKIKVGGGGNPSIVYYELGNPDYKLKDERYDGVVVDKDIHISIDKLVTYTDDKLLVQTCSPNNLDDPALRINILKQIAYSIIDKFQKVWDVVLFIGTLDIEVKYRPKEVQPINEDEDKNMKKVKSVLKAFKKGLLYTSQSGSKLYYELPDEYKILEHGVIPDNDNEVIFVQVGRETEDNCIKFFRESKEDENEMVRQDATNDMYENYKHILNLKLRPFNIRVIYKSRKGKWE